MEQTAQNNQNGGRKLEDLTKEELIDLVRKQADAYKELKADYNELKIFVDYVRNCKTHADYNRLRNIVMEVNKKFKK